MTDRDHNHDFINRPLRAMLMVAAPTVITMTSYTVMQFIDGLMVSRIGPDRIYISAQGNGGMVVWLAMSVALGLMTVVNTWVAQNLGAGRPQRGAAYGWTALWLSGFFAVAMLPLAAILPGAFAAMDHPPELVEMETGYSRILIYGAFFTMAARGIAHYFYGMHMPAAVMVAALVGNVVNVCCNAVLIFGATGPPEGTPFSGAFAAIATALDLPAMGVAGAALGTVIGSGVELTIPLGLFLSNRLHRRFGTRTPWKPAWGPFRDVLKLGWPGALMFVNEMICWGALMVWLIPLAGEAAGEDPVLHNTAGWIALRYMHVSFMPAVGLSIAVTAIVGRCMGMARPDLAARRAMLGLGIAVAYMGACALAFILFRGPMIRAFTPADLPPESLARLIEIGGAIMIAAAVFQLFDAVAIIMSGALRGAGDTVWPGVMTVILSWACIVLGGRLVIEVAPGLGSLGPWLGGAAYIILLGIALLGRFVGGKWRTIGLVAPAEAPEPARPAAPSSPAAAHTTGSGAVCAEAPEPACASDQRGAPPTIL
jgi:MATE family multidrug resistance protein